MSYPYNLTGSALQISIDGTFYNVPSSHPNFGAIKECIREGRWDEIVDLIDVAQHIKKESHGHITIQEDAVFYKGELQHGSLVDRILEARREGFDYLPLIKFMEKVNRNPSNWVLTGLFDFLSKTGCPITAEGNVLGYKGVRADFLDKYTGTVDYTPGKVIKMQRNKVADDRKLGCASGLHVGSYDYAVGWAGTDGQVLEVEFSPEDVVSVPENADEWDKIRVCRMKSVGPCKGQVIAPVTEDSGDLDPDDWADFLEWDEEPADEYNRDEAVYSPWGKE